MRMHPSTKSGHKLIHDGLLALSRASQYGMCVDVDYCTRTNKVLGKRIKALSSDFMGTKTGRLWSHVYKTPNLASDDQLRYILFDKLKLESPKKTDKGGDSVDNESLEILASEVPAIDILCNIRKYKKVQGTYIQGYLKEQVNGIMHPNFPLHTVITFRSSSNSPNFQNNPKRDPKQKRICRKAIRPRPGHQLVAADYSGIEVAIGECYHLDPIMKKYIIDDSTDMHRDMAMQLFTLDDFEKSGTEKTLRNGAKNGFVFPQFYGDYYGNNAPILCKWAKLPTQGRFKEKDGLTLMTGESVGKRLISNGIGSFDKFKDHIQKVEKDFWGRRFKVYTKWKEAWYKDYIKQGYMHTKTGFTCQGVISKNQIINTPIQGSAFHCLLKSFIEVDRRLAQSRLKSRLIGQIHDEMLIDLFPPEKENVIEIVNEVTCRWLLEQWKWINIPLKVEMDIFPVDESWASSPETIKLAA